MISDQFCVCQKIDFRLADNAYKDSPNSFVLQNITTNVVNESRITSCITADGLSSQDVGPFYGLPSKVKELLEKLRGIKDLYGIGHWYLA